MPSSLAGIRVHLSGSVPDDALPEDAERIRAFVKALAVAVLREGGSIIHGSHPSLRDSFKAAAEPFVRTRGPRDAMTAVRARKYATSAEHLAEIADQETYCVVQLVPYPKGHPNQSLMPLREWMADRSDVAVAIGGRHWNVNRERVGVPIELQEALGRGHPGFIITATGGAIAGYADANPDIFGKLQNGLTADANRALASGRDMSATAEAIVSQLARLPLRFNRVDRAGRFRILTLDGGGIRGVFSAAVLAEWSKMLAGQDVEVAPHFDLIAGTSTGAILALALGLRLPPDNILELYRDTGPGIFRKPRPWGGWFSPKYQGNVLRAALSEAFGEATLSNSESRLVIPSLRARHGHCEVFTTPHSPDRTAFGGLRMVDAAMASAAAPTYFEEAEVDAGLVVEQFLDGGIWANNPVIPALAEAIRYVGVPIEKVDVLSIGTVEHEVDLVNAVGEGKVQLGHAVADLFMTSQQHASLSIAQKLLGHSRLLRINQSAGHDLPLDATENIEDLARRGVEEARDTFDQVRMRFLDGCYAEPWLPG